MLTTEARSAIFSEHQRDHDDGPKWPREGCTGCAMLADNEGLREMLGTLASVAGLYVDCCTTFNRDATRAAVYAARRML